MNDSIITEIRGIRGQHAASMGYDLDRIYADLKARQEKHTREGWVIVPAPSCSPPEHDVASQRTRFSRR